MKFIKIFTNEKEAYRFAVQRGARVSIRYEWDEVCNRLIREFVVRY